MTSERDDKVSLSVVVPTLNEAPCIGTVLSGLLHQEGIDELLVVDGGSTDGTLAIVEQMGVRLHRQRSRGLGHGLHEAFALAKGSVLCVVDADGSHDWTEIPKMRAMIAEGYDYVLASRYRGPFRFRGPHRWPWSTSEDDSWLHEWGNLGFVVLCRALHGLPLTDVMMGFQMVRREALDAIGLIEQGQCFDAELKIKLHRMGYKLGEISAIEPKRIGGEAKLSAWVDGPDVLRVILKEWVRGGFKRVKPR